MGQVWPVKRKMRHSGENVILKDRWVSRIDIREEIELLTNHC